MKSVLYPALEKPRHSSDFQSNPQRRVHHNPAISEIATNHASAQIQIFYFSFNRYLGIFLP